MRVKINKYLRVFIPLLNDIFLGNSEKETARERIFEILSIGFGTIMVFIGIFFSFQNEIIFGISLLFFGTFGFGLLYYLSKFKNKTNPWSFFILFMLFLSAIWYNAHGFKGNVHLLLIPGLLAFVSIFRPKQYFSMVSLTFIYLVFLFLIERKYSETIFHNNTEVNETQLVIIYLSTIFLSAWTIGIVILNNSLKIIEIKKQKEKIEIFYNELISSVKYAYNIQNALLPSEKEVNEIIPNNFILYKPRDIVSGDFYWIKKSEQKIFIAIADCTGHGIPGAFMSMLGISLLNEVVLRKKIISPDKVLNTLRKDLKRNLPNLNDGMDIGFCVFNKKNKEVFFAGANIPLFYIRNNNLKIIKATRQPVGRYPVEKKFELNKFNYQKNDIFYMFSDGFKDQIGGVKKSKFMISRFKKLILENHQKTFEEQKNILNNTFKEWIKIHNKTSFSQDFNFNQFYSDENHKQFEKKIMEYKEKITNYKIFYRTSNKIIKSKEEDYNKIEQLDDVLVMGFKI